MPKKSYMNRDNLLKEGFFDKIKNFIKNIPKHVKVTSGLRKDVGNLNKILDNMDKRNKARFGNDYPDFPRYKPEDFVR